MQYVLPYKVLKSVLAKLYSSAPESVRVYPSRRDGRGQRWFCLVLYLLSIPLSVIKASCVDRGLHVSTGTKHTTNLGEEQVVKCIYGYVEPAARHGRPSSHSKG